MGILGVVASGVFRGLACALDFTTFPFVDTTGRHSIANVGVTQSSDKALFSGGNNGLTANLNKKDFSLMTEFDVSCKVNPTNYGGDRLLWTVYDNNSDTEVIQVYMRNTGAIVVYLGIPNTPSIDSNTQTGYVLPLATETTVRVQQVGNTVSLYAGGILRGSVVITPRTRKVRTLSIGVLPGVGLGWVGTIDDFQWINT